MSSEARPHAKSRLASGWRPCNGASTCGGAQGMAGAQGCRCRALGHRGAQPQAAGTPNPPTLGGGTPHHRFLASHPRSWGPAGCRLQGGGGGRRTTGSWRPLLAGSASPGGCWRLGCGGGGGRPHHRLLAMWSGQGAGGNSRVVSPWCQGDCWPGERHRSRRRARAPARPGG